MTGDASAQRALEEAQVLLGGSEFQRSQGIAALKALASRHPGSRAAEEALRLLSQRAPYRPPPDHVVALRNRWAAVKGLGHPALATVVRDLFADADPALEPLRRDAAERLVHWLDAEAEALRGASVAVPPPPRERLLPAFTENPAAAALAAAVRRWQEAAAVHRMHWLEAAFGQAEAQLDPAAAARALAEAGTLPDAFIAPFEIRAAAVRERRERIEGLLAACRAAGDGTWDTEAARAMAERELAAWPVESLPATDRPRVEAALAEAVRLRRVFLRATALACLSPDALAHWRSNAERIGAEPPDPEVFGPALQAWTRSLSDAAAAADGPGALEELAAGLAAWDDRLPGPVASWVTARRSELDRYAALWRNPAAPAGDLPANPVLAPPEGVRTRIEAVLNRRAEARRLRDEGDGGAGLESVFGRLLALAREAGGDADVDAAALDVGARLLQRRLGAALTGGSLKPARETIDALLAAVAASVPVYGPVRRRWSALETLARLVEDASATAPGDAAECVERWRRGAAAAAKLPAVVRAEAMPVVAVLHNRALDAVEARFAGQPPAPSADATLLRAVEEVAGSEAARADPRIRALTRLLHQRALEAALKAGDTDAADEAVAALEILDQQGADVARGRLHAGFLRASGAGAEALLGFISDRWDALSADPPARLVESLAEAAQAAALRGGSMARLAARLVGRAAALGEASPRDRQRLARLDIWFRIEAALVDGRPEGGGLLVQAVSDGLPDALAPALEALWSHPSVRDDPVVMALLHHAGHRLPGRPPDGPDPLVLLAERSRGVAGAVSAAMAGETSLDTETLETLRARLRAERESWNALAVHFASLPFAVPMVAAPEELGTAERRLAGGLSLLDEAELIADTDLRRADAVRRCELLREQILADMPPGALRTMLLDRADRLSRAAALPTRWADWTAAVAAARRPDGAALFSAAAKALDGVAAAIAAAGLSRRAVERLAVGDAAAAVGGLGPELEASAAGLGLDGLATLLGSLEADEARVREAVRAIRAATPRIPVGGRLNTADPRNASFLDLFGLSVPRSYRAFAVVHALLDDQDFDFLRRVEPNRFPVWLAVVLRDHDDA